MTVRKRTLTTGTTPKRLGPIPVSADMHHSVRLPDIPGKTTAVGMSRTESQKLIGPLKVLNPSGTNPITQRPHRQTKQALVDDGSTEFVSKRETPAPGFGQRNRRNGS